jgi:hypothetical protein
MKRLLTGLAVAGLLAACGTQGGGESPGGTAMGTATDSGAATGTASPACEEAFAPLADLEIETTSDLGDLTAELEPTIEGCESVVDWIAGAQQVVEGEVNPSTAEMLLGIQCNDPSLASSPVCEDLAAS